MAVEVRKYIEPYLILLAVIASAVFLETLKLINPGVAIGTIEVALECFAVCYLAYLNYPSNTIKIKLILAFGFLAVADASYVYSFYFNNLDSKSSIISLLTTGNYALSFIMLSWVILVLAEKSLVSILKKPFNMALAILLGFVAYKFTLQPYLSKIEEARFSVYSICQLTAIVTSVIATFLSLVGFFSSRTIFATQLTLGIVVLGLGDWAIRIETLMGMPIQFGMYEYLWATGVIILVNSVRYLKKDSLLDPPIFLLTRHSISGIFRMAAMGLNLFLLVVALFVFDSGVLSFRTSFLAIVLSLIVSALSSDMVQELILRFTGAIKNQSRNSANENDNSNDYEIPIELDAVFHHTKMDKWNAAHERERVRIALEQLRRTSEDSKQVAHDIRSPLSVLKIALKSNSAGYSTDKEVLRMAVDRLSDISNKILNRSKVNPGLHPGRKKIDICEVIERLVLLKKLEFGMNDDTPILRFVNLTVNKCELYVDSDVDIMSMLSNILNNSFEALRRTGNDRILITVEYGIQKELKVTIEDNGIGMKREVINLLGMKGLSYGKPGGSGFGLHSAFHVMKGLGGTLTVDSQVQIGTKVTLSFPIME